MAMAMLRRVAVVGAAIASGVSADDAACSATGTCARDSALLQTGRGLTVQSVAKRAYTSDCAATLKMKESGERAVWGQWPHGLGLVVGPVSGRWNLGVTSDLHWKGDDLEPK